MRDKSAFYLLKRKKMKRVISLVPSLTETLIEAGIEVVGRTRYCIHPPENIHKIAVVGGTKDIRWSLVQPLKADLLVLDQEENPRRIAEQSPLPVFATHVKNINNVYFELEQLAQRLDSIALAKIARRWAQLKPTMTGRETCLDPYFWAQFPGVLSWWKKPTLPIQSVLYLIWRNPWMAVSEFTFIGSVLVHLGVKQVPFFEQKYPKIEIEKWNNPETLLLFSSEPYDFASEREELMKLKASSALVNGESFSWFGIRSLKFLESRQT